jgi:hypothetical protein
MDDHFVEMTGYDYWQGILHNDHIPFTSREITQINSILPNSFNEIGVGVLEVNNVFWHIRIDSLPDSWFYVCHFTNYFICDQFDGLINCLQTILNQ